MNPNAVVGIDACRGGWCAAMDADDALKLQVFASLEELISQCKSFDYYLIDMPMGLSTAGHLREIDELARPYLSAKKRASIFLTPCREAVYARDYELAKAQNIALLGKSVSIQAWNICPKIRLLDQLLQKQVALRSQFYESHPEIAFKMLNGGINLQHSKKSKEGQSERLSILKQQIKGVDVGFLLEQALKSSLRKNVLADDFIDALVLYQTAKTANQTPFQSIEGQHKVDSKGIPMRMVFAG